MDDRVTVQFGAQTAEVDAATAKVKNDLTGLQGTADNLNKTFTGMTGAAKAAFAAIGIGLSIAGLSSFVTQMGEAGLHTEQLSAQLGVTGKGMGELKAIAKLTGVDIDSLALGLERVSLNVQHATKDALSPQAQALKVLGLNTKDLIGLSADKYFDVFRDAVSKFNPSLNLTNALMQVGGRQITAMLPAFLMGKEHLAKWTEQLAATRTGLEGFSGKAADTHARMTVLDSAIDAVGKRIFLALKPALDLGIEWLTKFFAKLNVETIREFSVKMVDYLTSAIIGAVALFETLGGAIDTVITKLATMVSGIAIGGLVGAFGGPGGALGGAILGGAAGGLFLQFVELWEKGQKTAEKTVSQGTEDLTAKIVTAAEKIKMAINQGAKTSGISVATGGASGEGGGGKLDAAAINLNAQQQLQATMARIQGEIALEQLKLQAVKSTSQFMVDIFRSTSEQRYQIVAAETEREYEVERGKLQQQMALGGLNIAQRQELLNKLLILQQQHNQQMVQLDQQAFLQMRNTVGGYVDALSNSFNSSLRDLLSGTMSFAQVMKKMIGDLVIFMIQEFLKFFVWEQIKTQLAAVFHAEAEAAKTAATAAGVAARTGAEVAGEAVSLPVKIGSFLSDMTARAAEVFAGIFANLSPLMGPLAAGPAAAGQAAVLAETAAVPKMATGAWRISQETLALVHPEEAVLPAGAAEAFRNFAAGGSGGGDTININAVDAASIKRLLMREGRSIVSSIKAQARGGASMGMA